MADLRAEYRNAQCNLRVGLSELDAVKRNLECEKFSREILNEILTEGQ